MWIIVREINQYDQDGSYFYCAFNEEPTREELRVLFYESNYDPNALSKSDRNYRESFITHLLKGGGRVDTEHEWYYLFKTEHGVKYTI